MTNKTAALLATAIFLSLTFIDETGVAVTLPAVQSQFGLSSVEVQWTLNSFFLALAICVLPAGYAADRIGYRRMFQIGTIVFIGASVACGLAPSGTMLIAARSCQGIGVAFMLATYALIIASVFPSEEQGAALGTSASIGAFFLATGPFIGGLLTETLGWRFIYLLNVPVGIGVAMLVGMNIPADPQPIRNPQLKVSSAASFAVGFGCLITALMEATDWGWSSSRTAICLLIAICAIIAFLLIQRSSARIVDVALFRRTDFVAANVVLLTTQVSVMCVAFWALWTQLALGMSPLMAGVALLPAGIPILFMGRIAGIWADRSGPGMPIRVGTITLTISIFLFAFVSHWQNYYAAVIAMILYAFGAPLTISPAIKAVLMAAPLGRQGEASGIFNTMRQLGAAMAIGVIGSVLNHFDRINTAIAIKSHAPSPLTIQEAHDVLLRVPALPNNLALAAESALRSAVSAGYADAMGYAMIPAGIFALAGCAAAFIGLPIDRTESV